MMADFALFGNLCLIVQFQLNTAKSAIVSRIIGAVLAWCSIEHKLLMDRGAEAISPELARSSLWCMGRLMCSLGFHVMNPEDSERLAAVIESVLQTVVDFALQKSFGILNSLSGERKFVFFFSFAFNEINWL